MRQSPDQVSFNAGEFTPRMKGRRDIEEYASAGQNMENWGPKAQGSMIRRGGSELTDVLDPAPTPPSPPSPP